MARTRCSGSSSGEPSIQGIGSVHPANRAVGLRLQAQQSLPHVTFTPKTFVPLPKRWVIERTNAWNDRPRRLAKDQERTIASSTAWLWFAEGRRLLRRVATVVAG